MIDWDTISEAELQRRGKLSVIYVALAEERKRLATACSELVSLASQLSRLAQDREPDVALLHRLMDKKDALSGKMNDQIELIFALCGQRLEVQQGKKDEEEAP